MEETCSGIYKKLNKMSKELKVQEKTCVNAAEVLLWHTY